MAGMREEKWMRQLTQEVIAALSDIRKEGRGLSEEVLSTSLGRRAKIQELIQDACRISGLEVRDEGNGRSYGDLLAKYNEVAEHWRKSESMARDLEESFRRLSTILISLASAPDRPDLNRELTNLRQTLAQKVDPGTLDSSSNTLKNYCNAALIKESSQKKPSAGRPEGLEENIRDILIKLINEIIVMEDETIQGSAQALGRRIKAEFTLANQEPFIQELREIIYQIKNAVHQEKKKLYELTQEIYGRLEETENDFLRSLDVGARHLDSFGKHFERQVDGDMQGIEQSFDLEGVDLERIRKRVFEKITAIRERFQERRAADLALLRQMEAEKAGVEMRLQDVHGRYQEFTQKSQTMLAEMEKFRKASLTDGLTGTYNRRAYDVHITSLLEQVKLGRLARLALVVFDIDYFKDFNTNYGHRAGDLTLQYVTRFAKQNLRKEDMLFRYGGDEFAIILPDLDLKAAAWVAEKIRSALAGVEFKIYKDSNVTVRVGLSIGVGMARPDDDPGSLFSRADRALYQAKDRGRNQVRTEEQV